MFPALSDVLSLRDNGPLPHNHRTVDVYKQIYQSGTFVRKNVFAILAILERVIDYTQQAKLFA
jgi:hypothetical protein